MGDTPQLLARIFDVALKTPRTTADIFFQYVSNETEHRLIVTGYFARRPFDSLPDLEEVIDLTSPTVARDLPAAVSRIEAFATRATAPAA